MSLTKFADGIISPSKLSRIENGHINPSTHTLTAIADKLELTNTFFVDYQKEDKELHYILNQLFDHLILDIQKAKSLIKLIESNYYDYLSSPVQECYFQLLKGIYLIKRRKLAENKELLDTYIKVYLGNTAVSTLPICIKRPLYYYYGLYHFRNSEYEYGLIYFNKLKDIVDNLSIRAAVTYNIALIYRQMFKNQKGILVTQNAISYYEKLKNPYNTALSYNLLATLYRRTKSYDESLKALAYSESISKKNDYFNILGLVYHNKGIIAQDQNRIDDAISFFNQAIKMKKKCGEIGVNLLITYRELIICNLMKNNVKVATNRYLEALTLVNNKTDEHKLLFAYNDYYLLENDYKVYEKNLKKLIDYFGKIDHKLFLRESYRKLALFYYETNKYKKSAETYEITLSLMEENKNEKIY